MKSSNGRDRPRLVLRDHGGRLLAQDESRREEEGQAAKSFCLDEDLMPDGDVGARDWKDIPATIFNGNWQGVTSYATLRTEVRSCWSRNFVYFAFTCNYVRLNVEQNLLLDSKTMRLWDKDVVEVYLQPPDCGPRSYYEFEMSPAGQWLDLRADVSRNLEDFSWESGMKVAAKIDSGRHLWHAVCRIPQACFGCDIKDGDLWKGNFYRIDGKGKRTFLAWQPTLTPEPRFAVPERFGLIQFVRFPAAHKAI